MNHKKHVAIMGEWSHDHMIIWYIRQRSLFERLACTVSESSVRLIVIKVVMSLSSKIVDDDKVQLPIIDLLAWEVVSEFMVKCKHDMLMHMNL